MKKTLLFFLFLAICSSHTLVFAELMPPKFEKEAAAKQVERLKSNNPRERADAAAKLYNILNVQRWGKEAEFVLEPLIYALQDNNYEVRTRAALALGRLDSEKAGQALIGALKDRDYYVRLNAARALGDMQAKYAVGRLIKSLSDTNESVVMAVLDALSRIGTTEALSAIISIFEKENQVLSKRAIELLSNLKLNSELTLQLLLSALKSKNESVRFFALRALGRIKDSTTTGSLIVCLEDNSDAVKKEAIRALAKINDPAAIAALTAVLQSKDAPALVRAKAAYALGKLGASSAIEALIAALNDPNSIVADFSYGALMEITQQDFSEDSAQWQNWWQANRESSPSVIQNPEETPTEITQQGSTGDIAQWQDSSHTPYYLINNPEGAPKFSNKRMRKILATLRGPADCANSIYNLESGNRDKRYSTIKELIELKRPFAQELMFIALIDEDSYVQSKAIDSLEKRFESLKMESLGPGAFRSLTVLLDDKYAGIRKKVMRLLRKSKEKRVVNYLIFTLDDEDGEVRDSVNSALAFIGEPALEPLFALLKDADWRIRKEAAETLGSMQDSRAIEVLKPLTWDANKEVCEAAKKSIDTLKLNIELQGDRKFERQGPAAVEDLIADLKSQRPNVRSNAAKKLGDLKDPRALEPLIAALEDEDANVSNNAKNALVAMKDPRAAEILIRLLNNTEKKGWGMVLAVEALAEMKASSAVEALSKTLLENKDAQVRMVAAEALGRIGDPRAIEPLGKALSDSEGIVRGNAELSLDYMLRHNPADLSDIECLAHNLEHPQLAIRLQVLKILGRMAKPEAVELIIQALEGADKEVSWEAYQQLSRCFKSQLSCCVTPEIKDIIEAYPRKIPRVHREKSQHKIETKDEMWDE